MNKLLLLLSLFLAVSTTLSYGQPDLTLNRAEKFAVLATTQVNNIGETDVYGDLGISSGRNITGDEQLTVVGERMYGPASLAPGARDDAEALYNRLENLPATTLQDPVLGNNFQSLTPGVYKINGDATLRGGLTLDGNGDPNAVFIIIIQGDLLSNYDRTYVNLVDGAQPKNVFWVVKGKVDTGKTTLFQGTVIAQKDITLGNGVIMIGRAISLTSVVNLHNNLVFMPNIVLSNLSVQKEAENKDYILGSEVTYTITARNLGPNDATGVVVREQIPVGLAFVRPVSASKGTYDTQKNEWYIGNMAVGETATLKLTFRIISTGNVNNKVVIIGDNPDPIPDDDEDDNPINVPVESADLSVKKTVNAGPYLIGDVVTYKIETTNNGLYEAKGVKVTEKLPTGLQYVSHTASVGDYDPITGIYTVGNLASKTTATLTIQARITAAGNIRNIAVVEGSDPTKDPDKDNDEDDVTIVVPVESADLSINKTVSGGPYKIGDVVTYTITTKNSGLYGAVGVKVTEQLPEGLLYVSHTTSVGTYDPATGIYTIGNLASNATATLTIQAKLVKNGTIRNVATVIAQDPTKDPDKDNDEEDETIVVTCPDQQLAITGVVLVCANTDKITYTVTEVIGGTYTYTLPLGWEIVAQSGNTVTVKAGTAPGIITATVKNQCGKIMTAALNVGVTGAPAIPVITGGGNAICYSTEGVSYTVTSQEGITAYDWSVTEGLEIVSGQNAATVVVKPKAGSPLGGTLTVRVTNSCGFTTAGTKVITITPAPAAPIAILGPADVCAGTEAEYSVVAVAGASSYTWNVPADWTILTQPANSNKIRVRAGTAGGNITVTADNSCGRSTLTSRALSVSTAPVAASGITGNTTACVGTEQTYSIPEIAGATGYVWDVPATWTVVGSRTSRTITVIVKDAGTIKAAGSNPCGDGAFVSLNVGITTAPAAIGAITGGSAVCGSSQGNTYSIAAVEGATTYVWTVPTGWRITSGDGTTSITVEAGTAGGTITVTASNACGSKVASKVVGITALPAMPGAITGNTAICAGTEVTYTVPSVAGVSYTWTIPTGWTVITDNNTNQIKVKAGTTSGNIEVAATGPCGSSNKVSLAIAVTNTPAAPVKINGLATACVGEKLTYSIDEVAGAAGYTWTIPNTWSFEGSRTGNTITVVVGTEAGKITAAVNNQCGAGATASIDVTPTVAPAAPVAITGPADICINSEGNVFSVAAVPGATKYNWTVPTGWTITAGDGTNTITVTATSEGGTVKVSVTNGCGTGAEATLPVSITLPPTAVGTITDNSNVCDGLTFSVSEVAGATSYTWTVSDGFTITSGQGTTSIKVKASSPNATGTVTVVANNGSCASSLETTAPIDAKLADGELSFPKAFSPNGDGRNDNWEVKNLEKFADNEVVIFNRWGSEIYRKKGYQNDWNGKGLGQGTYFYKVRVKLCDGVDKEFTGYTTIFR
ncbi:ice-binding family protein [Pontibacter ruber]|uniref:Ice-binding family protein n=1 Tax=Pontibacter ruber TaxID=1343895 RepID=A0ABW5CY47_9BACT|nr:ice-binding family protein [Pontibacter ruber]